jgi:molybdenum cofactor biosynthesis enzyme MoaA
MHLPVLETSSKGVSQAFQSPEPDLAGPRSIRAVRVLRISVTDRCNFRCLYCMPSDGVRWLPQAELLTFEEIVDVARAAVDVHGITRFKLTGGEPTVRHGIVDLVSMLRRRVRGIEDLSLTTNGFALESLATPLREAGLDRVTISIDSLRADRFKQITRTGDLAVVMRGLHRAIDAGFRSVKVNCVAMRGTNNDEFADFARLALDLPITVRFIEYMPLGDSALLEGGNPFERRVGEDGQTYYVTQSQPGAHREETHREGEAPAEPVERNAPPADARLEPPESRIRIGSAGASPSQIASPYGARDRVVSEDEIGPTGGCGAQDRGDVFVPESNIRQQIERTLGPLVPIDRAVEPGVGPAVPYAFVDHPSAPGRVAFISAMSAPFCSTCNRLRLTATGVLRSCLFEGGEVDLKPILRSEDRCIGDAPYAAIAHAMEECVKQKPDVHTARGNEQMSRIGG